MIMEAAVLAGYRPEVVAEALNPRSLELIILPTEKCNFRCTYCYEDFALGKMKPWIRKAVVSLIEARAPSLDHLTLSWFGGEPLLALDVIEEIAGAAMNACFREEVRFDGGLTTNAYLLTRPVFERLVRLNQRHFQITLDGDADQHNRTRRRADGRGTFDEIWGNLQSMRDSEEDFAVAFRLHVSETNIESLKRLIERLNAEFSHDSRFSIHFHRISDLGGVSGPVKVMPMGEYGRVLEELKLLANLVSNSEVELIANKGICYAAKANSLLLRADGRIGKCTVALDDPRNTIGYLSVDGQLDVSNEKFRVWLNGFRDFNETALGCPLSNLSSRTGDIASVNRINSTLVPG